jgi:hypothetical protein
LIGFLYIAGSLAHPGFLRKLGTLYFVGLLLNIDSLTPTGFSSIIWLNTLYFAGFLHGFGSLQITGRLTALGTLTCSGFLIFSGTLGNWVSLTFWFA